MELGCGAHPSAAFLVCAEAGETLLEETVALLLVFHLLLQAAACCLRALGRAGGGDSGHKLVHEGVFIKLSIDLEWVEFGKSGLNPVARAHC